MFKYLLVPLLFLTLGFSAPRVPDDEPTAKVTAVEGNQVTFKVTGELPAWVKQGGVLRAADHTGKMIFRVSKITKVDGSIVVVTTTMAKQMVVGAAYKLARGKAAAGC